MSAVRGGNLAVVEALLAAGNGVLAKDYVRKFHNKIREEKAD